MCPWVHPIPFRGIKFIEHGQANGAGKEKKVEPELIHLFKQRKFRVKTQPIEANNAEEEQTVEGQGEDACWGSASMSESADNKAEQSQILRKKKMEIHPSRTLRVELRFTCHNYKQACTAHHVRCFICGVTSNEDGKDKEKKKDKSKKSNLIQRFKEKMHVGGGGSSSLCNPVAGWRVLCIDSSSLFNLASVTFMNLPMMRQSKAKLVTKKRKFTPSRTLRVELRLSCHPIPLRGISTGATERRWEGVKG
ncbi:hypothetical protein K438DRAFT_1783055 [Mycena galopus ATCC 62051]|nr:hypothetical protein K438DRAFT_1783055 [Mycena galopus ATCC 62051]